MHTQQQSQTTVPSFPSGKPGPVRLKGLFGGVMALLLVFLVLAGPLVAAGESAEAQGLPSFLFQSFYASNEGSVYGIYEARHADLVLVEGGFDSGFRTGMVCRVVDGETNVGEVMLVEVRGNCAAALILQLEAGQVIQPGHSVRIKTVKF